MEMAEPFPRASPGVPPMAMALRLGAGPAKAAPTRRSVRRIFPAAHVAGKNDSDSFRLAPETRKGIPLPGPFPGGRGTKVPGRLPASIEVPAIRLAAERLRRREGRCGGRTGVPGQLPASIEASAIRLAAWRLCRREGCRCCVAKGSLVERGTFASAAGGRKSEQKGVAVVKIL